MKPLLNLKAELSKKQNIEEALLLALDHFYAAMAKDTMIGFFFNGKDLKKIIGSQKNLLLFAMGLSSKYEGKPVNQAHLELPPILDGHFNRRLIILEKTLTDLGFNKEAIQEWLEFEKKFYHVIVKK